MNVVVRKERLERSGVKLYRILSVGTETSLRRTLAGGIGTQTEANPDVQFNLREKD